MPGVLSLCHTCLVLTLPAEKIIEMPVDELALSVVADLIATNAWNDYNWS